jgi:hypothetical protein
VKGEKPVVVPMRTSRGGNNREHHMARARRVKKERYFTAICLRDAGVVQDLPCEVLLVRVTPTAKPLDDDNLRGSLKAVRDEVAAWLGVDDADPRVSWAYDQRKGVAKEWAVEISFSAREA